MKSFFENEGHLKVVVSKGVISTYEVNSLNKGHHVYFAVKDIHIVFIAKGNPIKLKYTRDNDGEINGLCELGLFENKNFQGIKKDPFFKRNI